MALTTRSPRPTTRSSSSGSGSGSPSPGPAGSATACWPPQRTRLAGLSDAAAPGAALLPPVASLRDVSAAVAVAIARAAQAEGLAQTMLDDPAKQVAEAMWTPAYPVIEPA